MCYLYIPEFGLSNDQSNLAYKLGIGGNQIITKVSHKIELEGAAKMTTSIVMRYWSSGVRSDHDQSSNQESNCPQPASTGTSSKKSDKEIQKTSGVGGTRGSLRW